MLRGRAEEQSAIDRLIADSRTGKSAALVVRGEPGIGKTALLDYAAASARGVRVVRGTGVESEAELPFAGLHLLLRSAFDRMDTLPDRQREALRGAFGLAPAEPGDRFLVGLAVLSLLSELAGDVPLLCLVDDAQWLDRASAEALLFVARRIEGEGIVLLFAARDGDRTFPAPGIGEMRLRGLDGRAADQLLAEYGGGLDVRTRERILAETEGNPLALIELPALLAAERPGGSIRPGPVPLTSRVQEAFHRQVATLPEATQTLLLVAAAEDSRDLDVILRAGASFGLSVADLQPAERAGLVALRDGSVGFRHPLVSAAVYHGAPLSLRLAAHAALAGVLDGPERADRRAWHLASATTGPDERVAAELERTAERAGGRSGHAAAAAYERAAQLTTDPEAMTRRLVLASEAAVDAGEHDRARALAERAARRTPDPMLRARLGQVRASAEFAQGNLRGAHVLLTEGAASIAGGVPGRAFWMLMEACHAAWFLPLDRELIAASIDQLGILELPPDDPLMSLVWLLRWDTAMAIGRGTEGFPALPEVIAAARDAGRAGGPRGLVSITGCALLVGQDAVACELSAGLVAESRTQGAIGWLPSGLTYLAEAELFLGRHRQAVVSAAEALRIARDTGQRQWASHAGGVTAYLAAVEGEEERCRAAADEVLAESARSGGVAVSWAHWALALLDLGRGRVEAALARLESLSQGPSRHQIPGVRSAPDQVEAAVRLGRQTAAEAALEPFEEWARRMRQPWIDALVHRCRALTGPDDAAERDYERALHLHERDSRAFEHARTRLLFGEWLRRARRRTEARPHLRAALEVFERAGAVPWAERARTELGAAGAPAPRGREADVFVRLTPQELQIVRLAGNGLSNRDIAAQLFLSPKTVAYHLYKAYPKLGVASRTELAALAGV
ncbi:AAA family ATPase [Planomonospora sp. ID67723]|uniref:helix-turn-helix transcriptional regulator n=1 Tax=Planomonospora sp. ID67723 TaxID=2738134 RepID=UPI0018C35C81|nr:helix-turn-helix transcriptional regulator [Planomonospora sp. ID67723]MBG0827990.1 AAA family ATPase [Planomonospora sp. ID67723]